MVTWAIAAAFLATPLPGVDTGRMCVVDMGSNTFKIIVGEVSAGSYTQHHVEKRTLGVGDDMSATGRISGGKLQEIQKTLAEFKTICASKGGATVSAVATAAFREAANGADVVEIGKRVEIPVEVASEERESALAYLTATDGVGSRAVIDTGSRTIELVAKNLNDAARWKVVTLGYRAAYTKFFLDATTFARAEEQMQAALARDLGDLRFLEGMQDFVGIELEEMAQYLLKTKKVHGARITLSFLRARLEKLRAQKAKQFAKLKRVPDIDRVLPRMVILEYVASKAGYESILVVERELGVGLIVEAGLRK